MKGKISLFAIGVLLIANFISAPIEWDNLDGNIESRGLQKITSIPPRLSDEYEEIGIIEIWNNTHFHEKADQENWPGNGSQDDPYIIEGYEIRGYTMLAGILILNTSLHFEIRDCYIPSVNPEPGSTTSGLLLAGVKNATVHNNTFEHNPIGIRVSGNSRITIKNNDISSSSYDIQFSNAENITLSNNTMEENGLRIRGSRLEHWNTHEIDECNRVGGEPIIYWKNERGGIVPDKAAQVVLANTTGVTLEDQNISGVTIGVQVGFSENNTFRNNTISVDGLGGISLILSNSTSNLVTQNTLSDGHSSGIHLHDSDDNEFIDNDVLRIVNRGLIITSSDENRFEGNTVTSRSIDFQMERSRNNVFANNSFGKEEYPYHENEFTIREGSVDNLFYRNKFFARNYYGANDEGDNEWDVGDPAEGGKGGNYWSDYEGDDRGDGIGDEPYVISDDNQDRYPWVREEMNLFYSLKVNVEGDGDIDVYPEQDEYEYGTEVVLTAVPDEGWFFEEWIGDYEGTEKEITITMNDDKEITAHFKEEEVTYDLTINVEGEGEVLVDVPPTDTIDDHRVDDEWSEEFPENLSIVLRTEPEEGWEFSRWEGDHPENEEEESEIEVVMDDDKSLTAHFEEEDPPVEYKNLTITSTSGGEVVEPGEGTFEYEHGVEVDLEVTADEGYHFVEWTGDTDVIDDPTSEETTIEMLDDHSITAEFESDEYELTLNVEGEGSTEPGEGSHTYDHGEEVTVEAAPGDGWVFSHWSGDVTGEEEKITITIDGDKDITAHFVEEAYFEVEVTTPEDKEEFEKGEVVFEYTVRNTGGVEGTQVVEITIGEEIEASEEVTLGPDEEHDGEFTWEAEEIGEFEVEIRSADHSEEMTIQIVEEEVPADPETDYGGLYAAVGFIVIGILVLLVLVMRDKKRGGKDIPVLKKKGDESED